MREEKIEKDKINGHKMKQDKELITEDRYFSSLLPRFLSCNTFM